MARVDFRCQDNLKRAFWRACQVVGKKPTDIFIDFMEMFIHNQPEYLELMMTYHQEQSIYYENRLSMKREIVDTQFISAYNQIFLALINKKNQHLSRNGIINYLRQPDNADLIRTICGMPPDRFYALCMEKFEAEHGPYEKLDWWTK